MKFPQDIWKHMLQYRGMECLGSRGHKRLVREGDWLPGMTGHGCNVTIAWDGDDDLDCRVCIRCDPAQLWEPDQSSLELWEHELYIAGIEPGTP